MPNAVYVIISERWHIGRPFDMISITGHQTPKEFDYSNIIFARPETDYHPESWSNGEMCGCVEGQNPNQSYQHTSGANLHNSCTVHGSPFHVRSNIDDF